MTLKEYIEKSKTDHHLFWRLSSGEQQNLLDEAIEKLEGLEVQATPEIVPGWVGIPAVEWQAIME
jgi:hypothetical protein